MICKDCGALIKHNEEYCRKCGALVINFRQIENKNLRNLCIENNMKGKLQSALNKITNQEKSLHKVSMDNKHENSIKSLSKTLSSSRAELKKISDISINKENNNNKIDIGSIIDTILDLLKI
ncbi:hypothetical protein [Terrisporobacter sp.]